MLQIYPVKVFSTTGSHGLAEAVCEDLQLRLPEQMISGEGIRGKAEVSRFHNENMQVQVDNVRGHFAVVIHTMVPSVSDNLIELFAMLHAIKDSHAADCLVVFPYMPYARSDRKNQPRISVMGKLLPKIISETLGVERVLLLDPHASHIKHYFEPSADEITATLLVVDYLRRTLLEDHDRNDCVIVYADGGAAKRFEKFSSFMGLRTAYIDKSRVGNDGTSSPNALVGDVRDSHCILIDDEALTCGTCVADTNLLRKAGAASIIDVLIHAPLAEKGSTGSEVAQRLQSSEADRIIITDSIPVHDKIQGMNKYEVVSIVPLLAEAIRRLVMNESLTFLHTEESLVKLR